jgi:hypothetical protein
MFTAYDAATGKFDPKAAVKDTGLMGSLVARISRLELDRMTRSRAEEVERVARLERDIRDANRTIRLRTDTIKSLEVGNNPAALKRALTKRIKESVALNEGLIDDLRVVDDNVYFTTTNLAFAKTNLFAKYRFNLNGLEIGRFLVMVRPWYYAQHGSLSSAIQAVNLDWRVGPSGGGYFYHHPFIKEGGLICWGDTQNDFSQYLKNCDLVGIIDLMLALLITPKDHSGWIAWQTYFRERGRLSQRLQDGDHYWSFNDGPGSLEVFFKDPKKKTAWTKAMKDAVGCGWAGMIQANNRIQDANAYIIDEVSNLYQLLMDGRIKEYREKIAAMKNLSSAPHPTAEPQTSVSRTIDPNDMTWPVLDTRTNTLTDNQYQTMNQSIEDVTQDFIARYQQPTTTTRNT